ncbi:hypothetical protein LTS12_027632 [Elasticomyces elasticus]|nr:hypothetical protein LTS12_027632 [Elasticomyces elasticus]
MAVQWAASNLRMFALENLGGQEDSDDEKSADEEHAARNQDGSTSLEGSAIDFGEPNSRPPEGFCRGIDDVQDEWDALTGHEGLLDLISSVMGLPIPRASRIPQSPATDSIRTLSPSDCETC